MKKERAVDKVVMSKKVSKQYQGKVSRNKRLKKQRRRTPAKKTTAKKTQSKGQVGPAIRTAITSRISVGDSSSSEDPLTRPTKCSVTATNRRDLDRPELRGRSKGKTHGGVTGRPFQKLY